MTSLGFAGSDLRRSWVAASLAMTLALAGCEAQTPPSLANRAKASAAPNRDSKTLEIVLAPKPVVDMEYFKSAARTQAGMDTIRFQIADVPAIGQADAVREAIRRDPPAIVVEAPATPDAELPKAVAEARARGILVVVVGKPLDGAGGSEGGPGREIVVRPRPFPETAAELVKSAARNAANAKVDPKAGALVVFRPAIDPVIADRVEALKKALADAGVAEVDEVRYEGDLAAGKAAILDALASHPKATLVLAADAVSLSAAQAAVKPGGRPYIMAGYTSEEMVVRSQVRIGEYAAVGFFFADRLVRKGINVAVRALRGEKIPDEVEVDVEVLSSPLESGLPHGPPDESGKSPIAAE